MAAFGQQKLGHLNSGNILQKMPEVAQANKEIQHLQDSLKIEFDTKSAKFQSTYQLALKAVNDGTVTPVEQSKKEAELNDMQTDLTNFQKLSQTIIDLRRQALLQPLLTKMQDAVKAVAKEQGYSYIFDVAGGSMLFANDSEDCSKQVEAKLGLK
jgi:outer membrane protein